MEYLRTIHFKFDHFYINLFLFSFEAKIHVQNLRLTWLKFNNKMIWKFPFEMYGINFKWDKSWPESLHRSIKIFKTELTLMNKIVGGSWPLLAFYFNIFCHYAICSNKNAFQWDAYRPLQWPSRGRGKESAWGCLPWGVHPPPLWTDRLIKVRLYWLLSRIYY